MKTRKTMLIILTFVLMFTLALPATATASTIALQIDKQVVRPAVAPVVESGTTLVPLRFISETLGAQVAWDGAARRATIETAGFTVVFTIDSTTYTVNGATRTLAVAPKIIDGSTMVPIRAFAESIGATVNYNSTTHTASVDYFTTMTGSLRLTGSTTVQPIAQGAADKLTSMNTGLSITVAGGGSGTGINDTIAGTNNIGMSSRDLTAEELAQVRAFSIANDGIAIIVHPSNGVTNLTKQQAADIFLGKTRNWNEVGGANAPILIQTRETGSGTLSTLQDLLLARGETVATTATPHASSQLIKQAVARDRNAIGFDSLGYVDDTVKVVPINGVSPSETTVQNSTYVMSRQLFVTTSMAARPTGNTAKFIDYLRTQDCQVNIVKKEGYVLL